MYHELRQVANVKLILGPESTGECVLTRAVLSDRYADYLANHDEEDDVDTKSVRCNDGDDTNHISCNDDGNSNNEGLDVDSESELLKKMGLPNQFGGTKKQFTTGSVKKKEKKKAKKKRRKKKRGEASLEGNVVGECSTPANMETQEESQSLIVPVELFESMEQSNSDLDYVWQGYWSKYGDYLVWQGWVNKYPDQIDEDNIAVPSIAEVEVVSGNNNCADDDDVVAVHNDVCNDDDVVAIDNVCNGDDGNTVAIHDDDGIVAVHNDDDDGIVAVHNDVCDDNDNDAVCNEKESHEDDLPTSNGCPAENGSSLQESLSVCVNNNNNNNNTTNTHGISSWDGDTNGVSGHAESCNMKTLNSEDVEESSLNTQQASGDQHSGGIPTVSSQNQTGCSEVEMLNGGEQIKGNGKPSVYWSYKTEGRSFDAALESRMRQCTESAAAPSEDSKTSTQLAGCPSSGDGGGGGGANNGEESKLIEMMHCYSLNNDPSVNCGEHSYGGANSEECSNKELVKENSRRRDVLNYKDMWEDLWTEHYQESYWFYYNEFKASYERHLVQSSNGNGLSSGANIASRRDRLLESSAVDADLSGNCMDVTATKLPTEPSNTEFVSEQHSSDSGENCLEMADDDKEEEEENDTRPQELPIESVRSPLVLECEKKHPEESDQHSSDCEAQEWTAAETIDQLGFNIFQQQQQQQVNSQALVSSIQMHIHPNTVKHYSKVNTGKKPVHIYFDDDDDDDGGDDKGEKGEEAAEERNKGKLNKAPLANITSPVQSLTKCKVVEKAKKFLSGIELLTPTSLAKDKNEEKTPATCSPPRNDVELSPETENISEMICDSAGTLGTSCDDAGTLGTLCDRDVSTVGTSCNSTSTVGMLCGDGVGTSCHGPSTLGTLSDGAGTFAAASDAILAGPKDLPSEDTVPTNGSVVKNSGKPIPSGNKAKKSSKKKNIPADILQDKTLRKYWSQRYRLFSKFNQGIKFTKDSWFSVCPEKIAEHVAERCRCDVIVDGFCGVGGNCIQFAFTCQHVIAIDLDPVKVDYARHNARLYGVSDRIEFIVGDFLKVAPHLNCVDVVYLDPPWGGPNYLDCDVFDVETMVPSGTDIFTAARKVTKNLAFSAPRNTSMEQLCRLAGDKSKVEIEQNILNNKVKTITAYYGELIVDSQ
ncbi:trimethylguanosine synthase-like isoform X2 [Argonauta hians]